MIKRCFDLVVAGAALLVCLPLLLLLALAIALIDGLPVLFYQERIGRNGIPFRVFKFRTMRALKGAEQGGFDTGSRSRVTPLGGILRKAKLDELPQLLNVIRGDMSIVGPRPEVQKWVKVYPDRWENVLTVRPGITGPASIAYWNEEAILAASHDADRMYRDEILPRKLSLSELYIQQQSLLKDIIIVAKTIYCFGDLDS